MFGYAGAELSGTPFLHLLAGSERDRFRLPVRPAGAIHVLRGRRKGGQRFDLEVALGTMDLDEEQVRVAVLQDITEAGVHRAALSLRDEVTGLIGRALFADRTDQAILAAERAAQPLAVLLVHLKLLKLIRATLGDGFADQLLLQVISRLQESLRRSDSLARMGTAELGLLLPGPSDTSAATQMAQWIAYEVGKAFVVEDLQVAVEVHVGVSIHPQDGRKTHDLVQRAETAMLAARRARLPVSIYRATDGAQPAQETVLLDGLREAIEENQLFLEFLPVVDLRTDRLSGVEALVRWQHPESGPVPANRFVGIAEKHGLMLPMALRVISLVARQQQVWREKGLELTVAINLSEHPLRNPQFVDILLKVLAISDGRADKILFEVTEKTLAEDPTKMLDMLSRIAGKGCQFSLDDFGTGSLALPYLQKLPLGEVKIDRSFVSAMTRDHDAAVVVRSAMSLGNALGLRVVAEGVEDRDTLEALRELGCTHVQGYLIGAPMT
ncbi:MAG: putative bifunctional diguanylate cyclase/phosphodiesterase, partial [Geminicoccaceae bacterium]